MKTFLNVSMFGLALCAVALSSLMAAPPAVAPFDAQKAKEHQDTWAKHLGVPVEITNSLGMKLVLIPPGEFMMGSPKELIEEELRPHRGGGWYKHHLPGEGPQHRVRITTPYWLGATDVTQEEYERVMGSNPSKFQGGSNRPGEQVSWNDAVEFCRKLSELPAEKAAKRRYELPTEAQWEHACRAGTTTRWYSGDDEAGLVDAAWFKTNAGDQTHSVGGKKPNAWGLYDMHGNVWAWCRDWYDGEYFAKSSTDDPTGPKTGSSRVIRGGSLSHGAGYSRSAFRADREPGFCFLNLGFRVCQVSAVPKEHEALAAEKTIIRKRARKDTLAREWTDSSGTHKIEAELVKLDGDLVHLKKPDGTILKVPLEKLSVIDRDFVRKQLSVAGRSRTWTDTTGHTIEAEFLQFDGDTVQLKKADGKVINLKHDNLSNSDLQLVRQQALVDYTEAIKRDPQSAEAYYRRGRMWAQKDDFEKAIADYSKAIALKPDHADALARRGACYACTGAPDKAITDCTDAIRIDPSSALAYHNRAAAHLDKGNCTEAIADCTHAIRLDSSLWGAYLCRGLGYLRKGNNFTAIRDFTSAIRLNPSCVEAFCNRGLAYQNQGDLDKAIGEFTEAIRLDPSCALAHLDRGIAFKRKNDFNRALNDYSEAIRLAPQWASPYHDRAILYDLKGLHDKAIIDLTEAIRLDPTFAMAYCLRAYNYNRMGNHGKALTDLAAAIGVDPRSFEPYEYRGDVYDEAGEYEKAVADYDEAIRLNSKRATLRDKREAAVQHKKLDALQKELQVAQNTPVRGGSDTSSEASAFSSEEAKEKRLAALRDQIDKLLRGGPVTPKLQALIGKLLDDDPTTRSNAAIHIYELGRGARPGLPEIIRAMGTADSGSYRNYMGGCRDAIQNMSQDASPFITLYLKGDDPALRLGAARALEGLDRTARIPLAVIIAAMRDSNKEIRHLAITALPASAASDERVIDLLIDSLPTPATGTVEQNDIYIGMAAAEKLGAFGPAAKKAIPALVQAVLDRSDGHYTAECRIAAERALPKIDAKDASLRLVAVLKTGDQELRARVAAVLERFGADGEAAIPALTEMQYSDAFPPNRLDAANALQAIRDKMKERDVGGVRELNPFGGQK